MKEQFVPYEIAIKLKEKGFNEPCFACFYSKKLTQVKEYDSNQKFYIEYNSYTIIGVESHTYEKSHIIAPLWQQVIDWFREKHQIEIVLSGITVNDIRKYHICLYYIVDGIMTDHSMLLFDEETREYAGYQTFTYPEARQTAIEYALTLI